MTQAWVIGAGRFGRKAVKSIQQRYCDWHITVIDQNSKVCAQAAAAGTSWVCADAVDYLYRRVLLDRPEWILPVIPQHVAFLWLQRHLAERCQLIPVALPDTLLQIAPNPFRGGKGELFVSNADFLCPDNCAEPNTHCGYTRRPRPRVMRQWLAEIDVPGFVNVVVASRQLAPGIGGYSTADLLQAARRVMLSPPHYLLSTACKCHAVMQAFTAS